MTHSQPASSGRVAVAVIEDDPHFCLFLESVLESSPRHRLVASAESAAAALAWDVATVQPHVILLDVGLPDRSGAEMTGDLVKRFPRALVLMLTAETDAATVLQAIQGGACGYVLKGGREEEILSAIDDALAGGAPMSPSIARKVLGLMRDGAGRAEPKSNGGELAILTEREVQILEMVTNGAADKEVGDALGLSRSTVKNALLVIYQKWRVRSRTEAAVKYTRLTGEGGR